MAIKRSLEFDIDFFFDLSRQTAIKRYTHKKFWNVVLHVATSAVIAWCSFYLLGCFLPYFLLHLLLLAVMIACVMQDVILGAAGSFLYLVIYYHALYITNLKMLQTISLLMLTFLLQIFIGQKWIENMEPFSGPIKGSGGLFSFLDFCNDVFMSPFHYGVTLLLRLDMKQELRWNSDTELRKIMDRVQKTP